MGKQRRQYTKEFKIEAVRAEEPVGPVKKRFYFSQVHRLIIYQPSRNRITS